VGGDGAVTLDAARTAALADARAAAGVIDRDAAQRSEALLSAARAEAAALLQRRRAAAERLAERERRQRLAEARGEARAIVLRSQQTVFEAVRTAAHAAARELVEHPGYQQLFWRLSADARERLAPAGVAEILAAPGGGVIARVGSREIDYSLDAQVERCLETMSGELARLWR
jgi:vacuolar-type H+-ATPase subunit E/Vma4